MAAKRASEIQAEESLALAVQEETERIEAEAERDQERGRSAAMSARIRALEEQLRSVKDAPPTSKRPNNYQEIPLWIQSEFAGRLQLCGKALRGLREAKYEDIELVCDLIELLATSYVNSKRGAESAWHRFEDEITRWGVEFSKSISGAELANKVTSILSHIATGSVSLNGISKKGIRATPVEISEYISFGMRKTKKEFLVT
jgi:hypothetical protein